MTTEFAKILAQHVYENLGEDNMIDALKKVDEQIVLLAISAASKSEAARYLKINRTTLIEKLNRYTRGKGWRTRLQLENQTAYAPLTGEP